jgi:ADP-dependent NAD(P)H-hydrate dehydratase / NAD(P)H-hydrate epimerase
MNPSFPEQPVYRAAQVREADRRAIQDHGIPAYELMSRAAAAALHALRARWPRAQRIRVVCGAGNNAGDGYVLARLARAAGLDARVLWLRDPGGLRGAAATAHADASAAGVALAAFEPAALADADLIVDALLGTGLDRPLAAEWAAAVAAIDAAGRPVLALDIPSGLHADTGAVLGCAVRADLTITFIAPKLGLYTGAGPDHVGQIELANLDVPDAVFQALPVAAWHVAAEALPRWLPGPRPRTAHKGRFGHVLVVGGQPGMGGAARLAAEAAARAGAGLVSVATHPQHAATLNSDRPELMCTGVACAEDLRPLLARATVVAVGPGLGQDAWARNLLATLWDADLPLVLDADALNLLARNPLRRDDWVLTPHPGEAARLLGTTAAAVQADRPAAVAALQSRYGGVVVLKGAGTLIHDGQVCRLSTVGNPGMASGGMGDVLTGVIAGLRAQGLDPLAAAAAGVLVHGLAGDAVARAGGERGLLAGDLLLDVRRLVNPVS